MEILSLSKFWYGPVDITKLLIGGWNKIGEKELENLEGQFGGGTIIWYSRLDTLICHNVQGLSKLVTLSSHDIGYTLQELGEVT